MDNKTPIKEWYQSFSSGFLITKAARVMLDVYHKEAFSVGLSPVQFGILFLLKQADNGLKLKDICNILIIDKSVCSKMVMSLVEKELVFLQADQADARVKNCCIQKEKWAQMALAMANAEAKVQSILGTSLTTAEQNQLNQLLIKLLTANQS